MAKKPVIDYGWEKLPKYLFILKTGNLFACFLFVICANCVIIDTFKKSQGDRNYFENN